MAILDFPLLDQPYEPDCSGVARWRKVRTLASTRLQDGLGQKLPDAKVILTANQRLQDGLGLPETFVVKKIPKLAMRGPYGTVWQHMVNDAVTMHGRDSAYVVTHYGGWQDNENYYLAMEHCGMSNVYELSQAVAHSGFCATDERRREVAKEMLAAVGSLHSQGLTHPDLQMNHFLLSSTGSIRLAGIAPTRPVAPVGCLGSTSVDREKLDVFKLGIVLLDLLELCFGKRPAAAIQPPASVQEATVDNFVAWLMHPDPSLRPSIEGALDHPWLTPADAAAGRADAGVLCGSELPRDILLGLGGQ